MVPFSSLSSTESYLSFLSVGNLHCHFHGDLAAKEVIWVGLSQLHHFRCCLGSAISFNVCGESQNPAGGELVKMSCKMLKTDPWLIFTFSTIASTVIRRSPRTRPHRLLRFPVLHSEMVWHFVLRYLDLIDHTESVFATLPLCHMMVHCCHTLPPTQHGLLQRCSPSNTENELPNDTPL